MKSKCGEALQGVLMSNLYCNLYLYSYLNIFYIEPSLRNSLILFSDLEMQVCSIIRYYLVKNT